MWLLNKRGIRRSIGIIAALFALGSTIFITSQPRCSNRVFEKEIWKDGRKDLTRAEKLKTWTVPKYIAKTSPIHNSTKQCTKATAIKKLHQSLDEIRGAYWAALQAQHYNRDLLGLINIGKLNASVYQQFRLPISPRFNKLRKEMLPYEMQLINHLDQLFKDYNVEFQHELRVLQKRVERRISELQHPADCATARKLVCDVQAKCGLGCLLHHYGNCLFIGLGTNRTVVLARNKLLYDGMKEVFEFLNPQCEVSDEETENSPRYYGELSEHPSPNEAKVLLVKYVTGTWEETLFAPFTIPAQFIDDLKRFHSDPDVWWIGQIVKHVTRIQPSMKKKLEEMRRALNFTSPIVGIHVRRTDKIFEASYRPLTEYMEHVDRWYERLELRTGQTRIRKVYLATDDPNVAQEMRQDFPNYEVLQADNIPVAKLDFLKRFSRSSLVRAINDIITLAQCDYFVGTFSSNMGRLAYELMQADGDRTFDAVSIDYNYHYWGGCNRFREVVEDHQPRGEEEIELKVGDRIRIRAEKYTLYTGFGENLRTHENGIYPISKSKLLLKSAPYPGL